MGSERRQRSPVWAIALWAFGLPGGCADSDACLRHSDCPADQVCTLGSCSVPAPASPSPDAGDASVDVADAEASIGEDASIDVEDADADGAEPADGANTGDAGADATGVDADADATLSDADAGD